ncbi:phosphate starvation-inducible PhoH-like protein, partial [Rhodoblastus acidophilus]
LRPLTYIQKEYISAIQSADQVIVLGPAGTGKTFIASTMAADMYDSGKINKIILTRPNVAAGKSIGFFPGDLNEKMAPWMAPVIDVLTKRLGPGVFDTAVRNGNIEVTPFETMRGRSFEDAFVLLDEAQNTSPTEMKMFLTRVGENCKVVINGDIQQSDLRETSGLAKAIHMVKRYMLPIPIVEFTVDDIVRSSLCKLWIEAWLKEEKHG